MTVQIVKTWDEQKQAIRDETERLLEIGKEPGVQMLQFGFEVDYELLPTVEYTVRKVMGMEDK